jgi:acyl-coenzyme A synthetase/AMP-(fatty) acid ligase
VNPERFHLTLSSAGRPVVHGWWASEVTARGKFRDWIGAHGALPGARVTLVDEETGETLTTWPDEA